MASGSSGSEADLIWWFAFQGGDLGLSGQSYDFGSPRVEFLDSEDAIKAMMFGRRTVTAVAKFNRIRPTMCDFAVAHADSMAICQAVYTPRGTPSGMLPARIALSLPGSRHTVSLLGILGRSRRLLAARGATRPNEAPAEFFRWVVSQRQDRLVRSVRAELSEMLEEALAKYSSLRPGRQTSDERHHAWVAEHLGSAEAAE